MIKAAEEEAIRSQLINSRSVCMILIMASAMEAIKTDVVEW
jgi:hypothetical protein